MTTTFSAHQYDMCYPPGIEHHWWTLARNRQLEKLLRQEFGDTDTLLEVGCGKGVVVKSLREAGFNIYGVELADVQPVEGAQAWVDSATDACDWASARRSEVTGILLLDVIEHLPSPEQFLQRLENSFPKLTAVVITVPTCQELWSNYDTFTGHHRRYTMDSLEELAANLNWTIKIASYFLRISYLPMRLMAALGIDRNTRINAPSKAMRPLHRLVALLCQLEQAIIPRRIRGSSAYAVCYLRKPEQQ